ncbi:MAG: hypothetical protein HQK95_09510 [Nitrospirae bacterium]|nr:hypothetical protein [Nitrospirota bacterium]
MADSPEIDYNKVEDAVRLRRSIMKVLYGEYMRNPVKQYIDLGKIAETVVSG